jgi:tRNA-specific 2-thiouridylase
VSHDPSLSRGRVLVAMSGGVDSSVAAALLQEQGRDVAGVTFKLFCYGDAGREARACCGLEGTRDAQAVARRLGIPHVVLDLEDLFRARVLDDFTAEYGRGRTPNPCVQCNTHVKFGPLLSWARANGYDAIATGHYVRRAVRRVGGRSITLLRRAADAAKDQSYVLWGLPPGVLAHTLFPLGELDKAETRRRARDLSLPNWEKEDSQDICFVDGRGYVEVLRERLGPQHPLFRPGPIEDDAGRRIGTHRGLVHYTVGQRRGLGLGGPDQVHVVRLETSTNTLRVGPEEALLARGLRAEDLNLFVPPSEIDAGPVEVQIRSRHAPAAARSRIDGDGLHVRFERAQRAVAPGQSCVVYRDGLVLAGGRIRRACQCCLEAGTGRPAEAAVPRSS